MWRAMHANPELIAPVGVTVKLIVHEGDEGNAPRTPVTCRMPDGDRVILHTPGSVGIVDAVRREAVAYITPALLADRAVRYGVIEGMTLTLVTASNRYPVHAAAIARGPVALLLAGPPGTGKSTLAYQAFRKGLRVLSDDAAYVQLEPELRLWGIPGRLNLLPTAALHFPELAGRAPSLRTDGSEKLVVQLPNQWPTAGWAPPVARRVGVCLLERQGSRASCARASPAEVHSFLKEGLGLNRARFGTALDTALAWLAGTGGWRLALSREPADGWQLVDEILTQLEVQA
jgi:hypothetical protein